MVRFGLYAVFLVALGMVNLCFDYAKIRLVVEDRISAVGALGAAVRFVRRHPLTTVTVYLADLVLFLVVIALYGFYNVLGPGAAGGAIGDWMAFVAGQLYIAARLAVGYTLDEILNDGEPQDIQAADPVQLDRKRLNDEIAELQRLEERLCSSAAPPSTMGGALDIAQAVQWTARNIATFGGNPNRLFLMGHSAGAAHAATYVAHSEFHKVEAGGLTGAILLSGIYQRRKASVNSASVGFRDGFRGDENDWGTLPRDGNVTNGLA